jgi:competence protein ComEA
VRLLTGGGAEPPPVGVARVSRPESPRSAGSARPRLYVHVAGAVRRPGLYRVFDGARVATAVRRAGGPTRGAYMTGVNLAALLEDGQQVVVPARARPGAPAAADAPVSLGSASVEQLERLDGIGPTLAQRIVDHRTTSGGFGSLDQLGEVEGIGEKRLEALKDALTP